MIFTVYTKLHDTWLRRFHPVVNFGIASKARGRRPMPKFTTGFTLVETLLAIAILSAAIIAPLSVAMQGLAAANTGKDKLVAIGLARETMEYVRNVRDSNRILNTDNDSSNDVDWLKGITDANGGCSSTGGTPGCVVDVLNSHNDTYKMNPRSQNGKKSGVIGYESSLGLYGYASNGNPNDFWDDSRYTRFAAVEENIPGVEARVTATVTWHAAFSDKSIVITERFRNW